MLIVHPQLYDPIVAGDFIRGLDIGLHKVGKDPTDVSVSKPISLTSNV